jgi:hypothetical protein
MSESVRESAKTEILAKAFRLGAILFAFEETLLTNRELVDMVCECLYRNAQCGAELRPPPAENSDEYYKQCLTLILENEEASDIFYWLALLYIMP